jgi:hypothetical protein
MNKIIDSIRGKQILRYWEIKEAGSCMYDEYYKIINEHDKNCTSKVYCNHGCDESHWSHDVDCELYCTNGCDLDIKYDIKYQASVELKNMILEENQICQDIKKSFNEQEIEKYNKIINNYKAVEI